MAAAIGVQPASISRFETGDVGFSLGVLSKLAEALRVPFADLFEASDAAREGVASLTTEERALVEAYRRATTRRRALLSAVAEEMAGGEPEAEPLRPVRVS